jgi:hypothetical protein
MCEFGIPVMAFCVPADKTIAVDSAKRDGR